METLFEAVNPNIELTSKVIKDSITDDISKSFDYTFEGTINNTVKVPFFPTEFSIGVIVGSSGSGKSTLLRKVWGGGKKT